MKLQLALVLVTVVGCHPSPAAPDAPPPSIDAPSIDAPSPSIDAPPAAACDPLADNDFDGAGSAHTKTGTVCGSDPLEACIGLPSSEVTTAFHCEHTDGQLANGEAAPGPAPPSNPCLPGYELGFGILFDGSMTTTCFAMCKPGDTYLGNPGAQHPNGLPPHGCNANDAVGVFGNIPNGSADSNGEHCMYSWMFEQDAQGAVHHSPTSDTVGFCFDHTKYQYDSDGDGMITAADAIIPPCASLPLHSTTALSATDLGCVSTVIGGLSSAPQKRIYIPGLPQFPRFSSH